MPIQSINSDIYILEEYWPDFKIFKPKELVKQFRDYTIKEMDYQKEINSWERKMYENDGVGAEILKDPYIKVCTTTTIYLADKLREYGKKVFIVPNKLSKNDIGNGIDVLQDFVNEKHLSELKDNKIKKGDGIFVITKEELKKLKGNASIRMGKNASFVSLAQAA